MTEVLTIWDFTAAVMGFVLACLSFVAITR
jgi:hypothetical protein